VKKTKNEIAVMEIKEKPGENGGGRRWKGNAIWLKRFLRRELGSGHGRALYLFMCVRLSEWGMSEMNGWIRNQAHSGACLLWFGSRECHLVRVAAWIERKGVCTYLCFLFHFFNVFFLTSLIFSLHYSHIRSDWV